MKIENYVFRNGKWNAPFNLELNSENTLITCFYDPQIDWVPQLEELAKNYSKAKMIGCSSSGEIFGTQVFDKSLSVSVAKFASTKLKTAEVLIEKSRSSKELGELLGQQLQAQDLTYLLVLSDGLSVNGTDLSNGITGVVKKSVVSGGLSGDGSRFINTTTVLNNSIKTGRVVAVGFYGSKLKTGTGSFGGWDSFGPERQVTKASGNVLFELDGKPALNLYKSYLGDQANGLPGSALLFPLAITTADRKSIVRTVLAVDEEKQNMTFAGDIPEGASAQLMKANLTKLVSGAAQAGSMAAGDFKNTDSECLAIAISCVGRRLVLGERIEDETEALQEVLPAKAKVIGFYSYGELSPSGASACELHNQTMTITLLQEVE